MWLAAVVVVNPIGNFPLNDDWSYALNVRSWVDGGVFKFNDWAAMTQLTPILLGIGVTELVGFSHTALRMVTLGVVFFFVVGARPFHGGAYHASLHAPHQHGGAYHAPLLFNPLFFSLSFTFMTDVFFLILFLVSMDMIVREKWGWGTVFAVLATLTRQTGVGLGLSLVFVGALSGRAARAHDGTSQNTSGRVARAPQEEGACHAPLRMSIMMSMILIAVLAAYSVLMSHFGVISGNYNTLGDLAWILGHDRPLARMGANAALVVTYLGLFTWPVIPLAWSRIRTMAPWWVFAGITVAVAALSWGRFPMTHDGNLLAGWGIGPLVLPGGHGFVGPGRWVDVVLGFGGAAGGSVGLVAAWAALRDRDTPFIIRWGVIVSIGFTLFLLIGRFFFDRYLLLLVPFALWVVLAQQDTPSRRARWLSIALTTVMAAYSILGTRQLLEVNRARWDAVRSLTEAGIPTSDIDGGFEVNGWHQNPSPETATYVIGRVPPEGAQIVAEFEEGIMVWRRD
jgi:hypothetical protein